MARKIVLLEMNEVPYRILDHFVEQNPNSSLARTLPKSTQFETVTTDNCSLSPWITWPSLHRGVNNEVHDIMHLGQNLERQDNLYPPIWKKLVDAGVSTGVFGPLHSWPLPEDSERYSFYLPDTFSPTPESHPDPLTSFQNFNLVMARESAGNVSTRMDYGSLMRFMMQAPGLGLRPQTLLSVAKQIFDERAEPWKRTRRRTFQSVLAFDLYMKQLKKTKPSFSNVFSNHVASAMHRYWAALFPSDFNELELSDDWQEQYCGEIDYAMDWFNRFYERLVAFADRNPEYVIVTASSMGQAATWGGHVDTQLYLRDLDKFMQAAGLSSAQWSKRPAMDPTVSIVVDPAHVATFKQFLAELHICGEPTKVSAKDGGFFDLHFGQTDLDPNTKVITLRGDPIPHTDLGMEIIEVEDECGSTGYHIPHGILFTYDPQNPNPEPGRKQVEVTDIAPWLLDHFGLEVPGYMNRPGAISL